MKKLLFIFFINIYLSVASAEQVVTPYVPVAVSDVASYRIGKYIVKIIEYNTRADTQLGLEVFLPPEYKLIQRKMIKKIQVKIDGENRIFDFGDTAGAFFNKIKVEKGIIKFQVDFYVLRGGNYLSECEIDANREKLPEPVCRYISEDE